MKLFYLPDNDLKTSDRRPRVIKVHKIRMWGSSYHYVLNGIANVLKEEYYDS